MALVAITSNGFNLLSGVRVNDGNRRVNVKVFLVDSLFLGHLDRAERPETPRGRRSAEKTIGVRQGSRSYNNDVFHMSMLFGLKANENQASVLKRAIEGPSKERLWL